MHASIHDSSKSVGNYTHNRVNLLDWNWAKRNIPLRDMRCVFRTPFYLVALVLRTSALAYRGSFVAFAHICEVVAMLSLELPTGLYVPNMRMHALHRLER